MSAHKEHKWLGAFALLGLAVLWGMFIIFFQTLR